MNQDIAIFGFDKTGIAAKPWADAGVLCYCIDTQHPDGERRVGNIIYVGADIRHWAPPRGNIVFAAFFPPCTHLAVSGSRWFKGKGLYKLAESIELFSRSAQLAEWCNAPRFIENPVSTISTYWRKPDYTFNPCDYADYLDEPSADLYTKKTCLWVFNDFIMPAKRPMLPSLGSKMHRLPPSDERANLRSATPAGFSQAIFHANYNNLIMRSLNRSLYEQPTTY